MSDAGRAAPRWPPLRIFTARSIRRDGGSRAAQPLSSAAFSWPVFSVNLASLMSLEDAVRHLREVLKSAKGGIVAFNCGDAKGLGFDPRKEPDPNYPQNEAHANVYSDGSDSKRKTRAKKLAASYCQVLLEPSF